MIEQGVVCNDHDEIRSIEKPYNVWIVGGSGNMERYRAFEGTNVEVIKKFLSEVEGNVFRT